MFSNKDLVRPFSNDVLDVQQPRMNFSTLRKCVRVIDKELRSKRGFLRRAMFSNKVEIFNGDSTLNVHLCK